MVTRLGSVEKGTFQAILARDTRLQGLLGVLGSLWIEYCSVIEGGLAGVIETAFCPTRNKNRAVGGAPELAAPPDIEYRPSRQDPSLLICSLQIYLDDHIRSPSLCLEAALCSFNAQDWR